MGGLRRDAPWIAALSVLAAVLRVPLAAGQNLWFDEWATWSLMQRSGTEMLRRLTETEGSPSLFYSLEWLVTRVAGTGDLGLRVLPLLCGLAVIPVAYALGHRLAGRAGGLGLAAVFTVHPWLVYLAAEARVYTLFVLLATGLTLAFLRVLERPGTGRLATWGLLAMALVITHHYSAFLIAAQWLWLVVARPSLRPGLGVVAGGIALVWLAGAPTFALQLEVQAWQRGYDRLGLLEDYVRAGLVGVSPPTWHLTVPAAVVALAAAALAVHSLRGERDRSARHLAGMVALAGALMLVVALSNLIHRNGIAVWVGVLAVLVAGVARARRPLGALVGAAALAVMTLASGALVLDERLQKPDWEQAAALAGPERPGVVVIGPGSWQSGPLSVYLDSPRVDRATATEIVAIGAHPPTGRSGCGGPRCGVPWLDPQDPGIPGVRLVERRGDGMWQMARFVSDRPLVIDYATAARFVPDPLPSFFDHSPGRDAGQGL